MPGTVKAGTRSPHSLRDWLQIILVLLDSFTVKWSHPADGQASMLFYATPAFLFQNETHKFGTRKRCVVDGGLGLEQVHIDVGDLYFC